MAKNLNRVHDLTGEKFNRLLVVGIDSGKETRKTYWICQCDCGNIVSVRSDALLSGKTKSCGCYKSEQDAKRAAKNHKHKQSGTRLYEIWQGMKSRCFYEKDARYSRYGGRGITVCNEWKEDFKAFFDWSLENGYSENLTIDRIDNDRNYEPSNCRWVTMKDQSKNRSTNIKITIGNSTRTLSEWCDIFNLKYSTINARYKRNGFISIDDLFNKG